MSFSRSTKDVCVISCMTSKQCCRKTKAPPRFELGISCLLDRRFNQLSHGASCARALPRGLAMLSPDEYPTLQHSPPPPLDLHYTSRPLGRKKFMGSSGI